MVRARIARWGNSQAVRLPKPLIEQAGLGEEVELEARQGEIVIRPAVRKVLEGWEESAERMVAKGDAVLVWPEDMEDEFDETLPPWPWPEDAEKPR